MSSHFHSSASLLASVVLPTPGLPITMKQDGLECRNLSSVWGEIRTNEK